MNTPLVSVLMPVFNAGPYLEESVESILSQSHRNFELLILDDASSDDSWENIKAFAAKDDRIKIFQNKKNLGYLQSCNILFGHSEGEFITFQDADDFCHRERLELQLQAFANDEDLGICGTQVRLIDENGKFFMNQNKPETHEAIRAVINFENAFCGASIMVTREVLDSMGFYRIYFDRIGSEDHDWANRITEKFKAANLKEDLYSYRQLTTSISKEINIRKYLSRYLVQHLAEQRAKHGFDDLEKGDLTSLDSFFQEIQKPYKQDPGRIYREYAAGFMYINYFRSAIFHSLESVLKGPGRLVNYRTLFYCLRMSLYKKICVVLRVK